MRGSLWLVPAFICLGYLVLIICFYYLERGYLGRLYESDLKIVDFMYGGTLEDARHFINMLISAMITMTTLALSAMMIVLSLAASQLGSRLVKSFMSDRKSQIYIGMFFGTIIACFALVAILHNVGRLEGTPRLMITVVFLSCVANLFILLAFIDHMAEASIADYSANRVSQDLLCAIKRLGTVNDCHETDARPFQEYIPANFAHDSRSLFLDRSGYIQNIDYKTLLDLASADKLIIRIRVEAGYYILAGEEGIQAYPVRSLTPDIEKSIFNAFIIGPQRTRTQDLQYSVRHLVEMGTRALSPSINDCFTAMMVLDKLSMAMAVLFKNQPPPHLYKDKQGTVRVIGVANDERAIIFNAFSQILHAGQDKPDILLHLINKLRALAEIATDEEQKEGIEAELARVKEAIDRHFGQSLTGKTLLRAYQGVTPKTSGGHDYC